MDRPAAPAVDGSASPRLPALVSPQSPLLPVALAATAGIMLDRYTSFEVSWVLIGLIAAAIAWVASYRRSGGNSAGTLPVNNGRRTTNHGHASVIYLWTIAGLLGAAWHHVRHQPYANDIGHYATAAGAPVRLRGIIIADPASETISADEPLRSRTGYDRTTTMLELTELHQEEHWIEVRGKARVSVAGRLTGIEVGDDVELLGQLHAIPGPGNPGEFDWQRYELDQGVRASVHVKTADGIRAQQSSPWSVRRLLGLLANARNSGVKHLRDSLSDDRSHIAAALLLGDQTAQARGRLDGYQRTAVFHVLVISGQHLVILCGGLWFMRRFFPSRRLTATLMIIGLAVGYTLLTGARPPILRAAIIVCAICAGRLINRRTQSLNSLALAWLIVAVFNPSDMFTTGCQLSFLSVLVLYQVVQPWYRSTTELDANSDFTLLFEKAQPFWQRFLFYPWSYEQRRLPHWQRFLFHPWTWFVWSFISGLLIWLALTPLLMARYHLCSPIALLLNPFVILLSSVALFAGFLLLLLRPLAGALTQPLAWLVDACLWSNGKLVSWGEQFPAGYWYTSGLPEWWLWGFYVGLIAVLLSRTLKQHWKPAVLVALAWLCVGLFVQLQRPIEPGLRCTFLAVGHGNCVVIEMPDGRTLLYDAGSMAGPEVAERQIAPFLWSRGITRLDEVFISHADLDHFNGLPALLERFPVNQVNLTPTFDNKHERGVRQACDSLSQRRVATRILRKGDHLELGELAIDVLYPPPDGPGGPENTRSMVLLLSYRSRTILLTGDLEQPGLGQVIGVPLTIKRVDVLMAPHHGSPGVRNRESNTEEFARWARAGLVISSEGRPRPNPVDPYAQHGGILWRTWDEGAVTVRIKAGGVSAETFRTAKRWNKE